MDQSRTLLLPRVFYQRIVPVLGMYKYVFLVAQIGDWHDMLGMRNGEPCAVRRTRDLGRYENRLGLDSILGQWPIGEGGDAE